MGQVVNRVSPRYRSLSQRLLPGVVFAVSLFVIWFYGLIPVTTGCIVWSCVGICLASLAFEPGSALIRVACILTSVSLSLMLGDLALRPMLRGRLFGPAQLFMYRWAPMPSLWRYKPNVSFDGFVHGDLATPDYQERRREIFQTDSYGFRNTADQEQAAQKGNSDLILLGDSVGEGVGTTQEKTWGALLQNKYGLRTYNLSMAGSGPWHELMNLKIACQRLRCDGSTTVLWSLFTGNDLQDEIFDQVEPSLSHSWLQRGLVSLTTFRNMSPLLNFTDRMRLYIHPLHNIDVRELPDGKKIIFRLRYERAAELSIDQVRHHDHYSKLVAVVDEMKRFADSRHFGLVVVVTPPKEEIYSAIATGRTEQAGETSGFAKAIAELCRKNGLPFLDLTPFFAKEAKRELDQSGALLWWSDDTHWNERGHELAAAVVHDHLTALLKDPDRTSGLPSKEQ
jgi:lysophospholipase L1-like esterase